MSLGVVLEKIHRSIYSAPNSGITKMNNFPPSLENLFFLSAHKHDEILIFDTHKRNSIRIKSIAGIHQVLLNENQDMAIAIPRMKNYVPIYSIATQSEAKRIINDPDYFFYGHGALFPNRKIIALSEVHRPNSDGFISIWNLDSLQLIKRLPTSGTSPHDCVFDIENQNLLYVVNGGLVPTSWDPSMSPSYKSHTIGSLVEINVLTNESRLLKEFDLNWGSPGHIAFAKESLAIITAPENNRGNGDILITTDLKNFKKVYYPKDLFKPRGQALSITYEPKESLFVVTHPEGETVSFWDAKNGEFVNAIPIWAQGVVVPCPGYVLLNSGQNTRAIMINTTDWTSTILNNIYIGNGPHLTMVKGKTL